MGTNSNSVVVSFSIAILLLLLLLLLLTYNSKCSMRNMNYAEGFETDAQPKKTGKSVADNAPVNTDIISGGIDRFEASQPLNKGNEVAQSLSPSVQAFENQKNSQPETKEGFMNYAPVDATNQLTPSSASKPEFQSCFPRDRLTAEDLLPKDAADSKWARLNPSGTGDIHDQNYLTAGYHIGVNTVGQSLRNANLQLRSEIPNPQIPVGPWMISTIEPDLRQNTLEIGSSPSY